jgi:hypothetical protein
MAHEGAEAFPVAMPSSSKQQSVRTCGASRVYLYPEHRILAVMAHPPDTVLD